MMRCGKLQQYRKSIMWAAVSASRVPVDVPPTATNRRLGLGRRLRRGFSLVELLVVIAIILILMALLLPTLERMQYAVRSVQCLHDKRQLVMGLTQYANDNSGQYPYAPWGSGFIQNPHDHQVWILKIMNENYGIPYANWMCAVGSPSQASRNLTVSNGVIAGINSGYWKWIAPEAIDYWVEQGGYSAGNCYNANPGNNLWSRYALSMMVSNVIVSDNFGDANGGGSPHLATGKAIHSVVVCADGHGEQRPISQLRQRWFTSWWFGY